jgi:putative ABC transport system permease protein
MFKNYLKSYFRNLWKNRTYTFLNIAGLAVGITCSTLIFLWIEDEFNWDHQFAKKHYLYQVEDSQTYGGTTYTFTATPGPLAAGMNADIPGIAASSHLTFSNKNLFSLNDKPLYEDGNYCDSSFLSMFSLTSSKATQASPLAISIPSSSAVQWPPPSLALPTHWVKP